MKSTSTELIIHRNKYYQIQCSSHAFENGHGKMLHSDAFEHVQIPSSNQIAILPKLAKYSENFVQIKVAGNTF